MNREDGIKKLDNILKVFREDGWALHLLSEKDKLSYEHSAREFVDDFQARHEFVQNWGETGANTTFEFRKEVEGFKLKIVVSVSTSFGKDLGLFFESGVIETNKFANFDLPTVFTASGGYQHSLTKFYSGDDSEIILAMKNKINEIRSVIKG